MVEWPQANVMAVQVASQLSLCWFLGMGEYRSPHRDYAMIEAGSHMRSADDLRRSAQMAAAQKGDRAAYEALLRDCVPLISAIAARKGVPVDRCDDVVQDVLLTIHRARRTYDPARSFTAWLHTIAERRAIDLMRRLMRQREREVYAPSQFEAFAEDDGGNRMQHSEGLRGRARLHEAIAALPKRQREAVQVLILKEQTLAEAAVATRRSKGALKVNLHRALKALRNTFNAKDNTS